MVKLFIDPGHGGAWPQGDPGAVNGAYFESMCNLAIALRLRDSLAEYDVEVRLSREDDSCPSLSSRAHMANMWGANLFLSIHANAGSPWASGTLAVLQIGKASNHDLILAEMLTEAVSDSLGIPQRPVSYLDVAVLRESTMPAVLLETAFISNSEDCMMLFDPLSQLRIAGAICQTLAVYFGLRMKNPPHDPYFAEREWVMKRGISDGSNPDEPVLRKELWAMIHRYDDYLLEQGAMPGLGFPTLREYMRSELTI